ncbi:2-hydroxy-3-oxopropionate reductase [Mycolicibacterium sp. 050158]|uniref:2-hydroxy-3-oxopropionate reductase n=1 Tax=Mycolicibacterium sp. 050158 TaxID=3090602 RepID=UPI00299CFCA8|nr:2-hydroxy-3-oxopropionate reductase [Mycolicibacterium sp. 050158]MDX1893055.1 2-hydroxy-3-oxopropionate reductase [Mycolicibacterium sp. 050158]
MSAPTSNPTVAFIGLGIMGSPMAANLCAAGLDVVGFSRTMAKVDALVAKGMRPADDVAGAVRDADVVVTMLPDSPDVEAVALGADGIVESAAPGTLFVDMSTIRPDTARAVAEAAEGRGLRFLDAPVSGGEQAAVDGTLSIMVGGSAASVADATPVLRHLGTTIVHVGPVGAGQTVKAANQLIVAGNIELLAEALLFLEAQQVDTEKAISVLEAGLAGSTVMARKARSMVARKFAPGFRIALHDKDLGIFTTAARTSRTATPLGAVVAQLMSSAHAQGDGDLDHSALFRLVERLSGRPTP